MGVAGAGWMLGLSRAVAIVTMFLAPMIAGRSARRGVVVVAVGTSGVGVLGLLVAGSTASILWVVLLGLGQGRPSAWRSPSSRFDLGARDTPLRSRAWPSRSVTCSLRAGLPLRRPARCDGCMDGAAGTAAHGHGILAYRRYWRSPRRPRRYICPGRSRVSGRIYTTPDHSSRVAVAESTTPQRPWKPSRPNCATRQTWTH